MAKQQPRVISFVPRDVDISHHAGGCRTGYMGAAAVDRPLRAARCNNPGPGDNTEEQGAKTGPTEYQLMQCMEQAHVGLRLSHPTVTLGASLGTSQGPLCVFGNISGG